MPMFTIETSYRIPIYRQRAYEAETLEAACALAVVDDDWEDQKEALEDAGETYVSGAWPGDVEPYSVDSLPIPPEHAEA